MERIDAWSFAIGHYNVYTNGALAGTSTAASFNAAGLSAVTSYKFSVAAVDVAGNASAQSAAISATTKAAAPYPAGFSRRMLTLPSIIRRSR